MVSKLNRLPSDRLILGGARRITVVYRHAAADITNIVGTVQSENATG